MFRKTFLTVVLACIQGTTLADDTLFQYEGDIMTSEKSAGSLNGDPCDGTCTEFLEDGHFVFEWPVLGDSASYGRWITIPPEEPLPSLWIEWRFRSNHPIGPLFDSCDGEFVFSYEAILNLVFMYGDTVVSFSGGQGVTGLAIEDFHTYRFESLDGVFYRVSVDGLIFIDTWDIKIPGAASMSFRGNGGCNGDWIPDNKNEWDRVRYGTLGFGEQIVAADPPGGYLDPDEYAGLDRFAITFDSPNYVYIADITVEVSGGDTPVVTQTWRRDGAGPETLEIVLDRPIPAGEHTRFIMTDGVITNIVDYSFITGDADGDGDLDLRDFAMLSNCFAQSPPTGVCNAFDFNNDETIDLTDHAAFVDNMEIINP